MSKIALHQRNIYIFLVLLICVFLAVLSLCCSVGFLWLRRAGATLQLQCMGISVQSIRFGAAGFLQLWRVGSVAGVPGLQSAGSVVGAHKLCCSPACRIFPTQGPNLCLLHQQMDSLTTEPPGKLEMRFFFFNVLNHVIHIQQNSLFLMYCSVNFGKCIASPITVTVKTQNNSIILPPKKISSYDPFVVKPSPLPLISGNR